MVAYGGNAVAAIQRVATGGKWELASVSQRCRLCDITTIQSLKVGVIVWAEVDVKETSDPQ